MAQILDCTIRDGGYYTNWDFDKQLVNQYLECTNSLPIDYLEIGYRSIPLKGYLGKYFYCPVHELEDLKSKSFKKLVIILNEKDIRINHLDKLLKPIIGLVNMVRIAIDPENLGRAIILAEGIKKLGFEVGFNVMYMSKWAEYKDFTKELKNVSAVADYFYMVDSFGGVYPQDVINTIELVKSYTDCKLGFHGHNNLELALINTLTALENGVDMVDATIMGLGRGAGNVKTELLLTALNAKKGLLVDFNVLGNVVNSFSDLLEKYQWGTTLPYMISGSNSLPQKDVMDWYTTRVYSLNSMVRALQNQKNNLEDNEKLPKFKPSKIYKNVLIVGGGCNSVEHSKAIIKFINRNPDLAVIHASSKNALHYKDINSDQYYCLVGNEGHRLEKVFHDLGDFEGVCVLPPFPRKMGTYIPNKIYDQCFELAAITLTNQIKDSHSVLALQIAVELQAESVYVVGFDGYQEDSLSQLERTLVDENENLFNAFQSDSKVELISLTPTKYKALKSESIYSLIW